MNESGKICELHTHDLVSIVDRLLPTSPRSVKTEVIRKVSDLLKDDGLIMAAMISQVIMEYLGFSVGLGSVRRPEHQND